MLFKLFLLFLVLGSPYVFKVLEKRGCFHNLLSPVVLCYLLGILIGNLLNISEVFNLIETLTSLIVLVAIPMILFPIKLSSLIKLTGQTIKAFGLAIISVGLMAIGLRFFFIELENYNLVASMFAACYSGGTPNLNAVGIALNAPKVIFPKLITIDAIISGLYLLFLMSFAKPFLSVFLNKKQDFQSKENSSILMISNNINIIGFGISLGLSILILLISIGTSFIIYNEINAMLMIVFTTSFGILCSLSAKVRAIPDTYESGQYLLLSFCVGIGLLSDFSTILDQSLYLLLYIAILLSSSLVLYFILCYLFKIDVDTAIIASTAAVFGPPFIGSVADVLNNSRIVASGMICGVFGLAIGNYYGISISILLNYLY
tara:strand:+ start:1966 stop:3087 length:1122 start_codon:yes stop_codon:yes gene_type:complete